MKKKFWITAIFPTIVVLLILFNPTTFGTATIIWGEDFESGLDNWDFFSWDSTRTLFPENVSTSDGVLRVVGNESRSSIAEHPSTQTTGTWSFDVDVAPTEIDHFYIAFFGEKFGNFTGPDDALNATPYEYGIAVVTAPFGMWNSEFVFYKRPKTPDVIPLGRYSPTEIMGWHHFDITRDNNGLFNVFINGTLRKSFQDNSYTISEVFRFMSRPGPGIDNIVVRDDFLLTTTTATTTTDTKTPGFELNLVFFFGLIPVIFYKKRRIK